VSDFTKDIIDKLPKLLHDSAVAAIDNLPIDQLARCESPIEKLFLCAVWSRGAWTGRAHLSLAPTLDGLCMDAREHCCAVVSPQITIGPYRVDFLFAMYCSVNEPMNLVAVECDGHDFHEKTKEQAARDKARDRDLTMRGIQVFRYTGSEIWRDAGWCADEVIGHVHAEWADALYRKHERAVRHFGSQEAYLEALKSGVRFDE